MTDRVIDSYRAELDRLIAVQAALVAAGDKFTAHYPHGINPDLDEAYGDMRDALALAKGEKGEKGEKT